MTHQVLAATLLINLMLGTTACTTVHFRSKGQIPVYIGPTDAHVVRRHVIGQIEFYMWGLIPRSHFVLVDELIMDEGFVSAANVASYEYQTFWDLFFSVASLGIYIPKHYRLDFFGLYGEYDE
jgi:hypothetical protein